MAKIKIQGNASGTGTLTLTAPNTNSDRIITLPDGTGELLAKDSSGNLGIGTNSPSSKLSVSVNDVTAYNSSAVDGQVGAKGTILIENDANSNTSLSQLVFNPRMAYGFNRIVSSGGSLPFMTFNTNDSEAMRITSSGNVGIGTSSPSVPLHVNNSGSSACRLYLENTGNTSAGYTQIWSQNNDLVFNAGNSERMRIDSAGRVTTPNQPAFRVTQLTGANNAGMNPITYATTDYNIGGVYSMSTNRFTAPVSGIYTFNFTCNVYKLGDSRGVQFNIYSNGSIKETGTAFTTSLESSNTHTGVNITTTLSLSANDYITTGFSYHGSQVSLWNANYLQTFSGYLLG